MAAPSRSSPDAPVRFRLLGDVGVVVDGAEVDLGGPKQRAVLAVLALDAGRVVSVDRLIEVIWGERAPEQAVVSLRSYLSNLRRALGGLDTGGGPIIESRRPGYVLHASPEAVDVVAFEALVEAGRQQLAAGHGSEALAALDEALALWGGPPLSDVAAEVDLMAVISRLEARHLDAVEARFDARLALGEHAAVVPELTAAVNERPLVERLRAQLALALYRAGRQVDALRAIEDTRRTLAEEVGVELGPELRALETAILEHDPTLLAPTAVPSVAGEPTKAAAAPPPPASRAPLFGRDAELDALLGALESAVAGAGRAAVVSGEPGIGKTRLLDELMARAADVGAVATWSRCPEAAVSAAYWPWLQLARELGGSEATREVGDALVQAVAPEARTADDDAGGEADQFQALAAAFDALRAASTPLLLVIDDLQWADAASLRLLSFIAGDLQRVPVLVAVTTRPPATEGSPTLEDCLGELARTVDPIRLHLEGLSEQAVSAWLDERSDRVVDPAVATFVHGQTGGNPFFVRELAALLASDDRLDDPQAVFAAPALPAAVQDVVRRRASRLAPDTQQLLSTAAVIGRRFDLDVVASVAELSEAETLDRLEPAVDAGLVDTDESRMGRFAFSHALVAETLAAEQRPVRRARVHAATAAALERLRGTGDDEVPELAHHALEGATAGSAGAAVDYSVRAAELAGRTHAPSDAAVHWNNARRALELADPTNQARREELSYRLGIALGQAGDVWGAHDALMEAATAADARGDVEATARALAVVHSDDLWSSLDWRQAHLDTNTLLERTIDRLGTDNPTRRAELLGALSTSIINTGDAVRANALSAEAVDLARRHGPPIVLARALVHRFWSLWRPSTNAERTKAAAEMVDLVSSTDELPDRFTPIAHTWAFSCAAERGDPDAMDAHLAMARATCDPARMLALHAEICWAEASPLLLRGQFAEAQRKADEMYDAFRRTRRFVADATYTSVVSQSLLERGRIDEFDEAQRDLSQTPYDAPSQWQWAWGYAVNGLLDRAEAGLAAFDGEMPDDWYRPVVLVTGMYAAVAVGRRDIVEHCAPLLRRDAALIVLSGSGGATLGPTSLALATADAFLGDVDSADRLLASGLAQAERMGARPWVARALALRYQLHGDEADRQAALAIAGDLDMAPLVNQLNQ